MKTVRLLLEVPVAGRGKGMSGKPEGSTGSPGAGIARRGLMLVLSSPSGAGKTALSRRLLAADPMIDLSVSVTTRKQRPGEVDGREFASRSLIGVRHPAEIPVWFENALANATNPAIETSSARAVGSIPAA